MASPFQPAQASASAISLRAFAGVNSANSALKINRDSRRQWRRVGRLLL